MICQKVKPCFTIMSLVAFHEIPIKKIFKDSNDSKRIY